MKVNIPLLTLMLLPLLAASNSSESYTPSSAIEFQQTTNSRIVVEESFLRFFTGGRERITVDADGNIGIGSITPTANLHVLGSEGLLIERDAKTMHFNAHYGGHPHSAITTDTGMGFRVATNKNNSRDNPQFVIDSNGNVGIGTTDPSSKLEIQTVSSGTALRLQAGGNADHFFQFDSNSQPLYILQNTSGTNRVQLHAAGTSYINGGNFGIGITNPASQLQVSGGSVDGIIWPVSASNTRNSPTVSGYGVGLKLRLSGNHEDYKWGGIASVQEGSWANSSALALYANESEKVRITSGGAVGIGTTTPSQKLDVNGNVNAIKYYASGVQAWPDYVFEDTYQLNDIEEVENFIEKNHHLPEIPSAAEVEANGIDIVDMQAKLLQKIEELTLYVIDQNKKIEFLSKDNKNHKKEISRLKTQIKK